MIDRHDEHSRGSGLKVATCHYLRLKLLIDCRQVHKKAAAGQRLSW